MQSRFMLGVGAGVLVRGERIAEVGPADQVKVPAGVELIDLGRACQDGRERNLSRPDALRL
jgi:hypothetical protein